MNNIKNPEMLAELKAKIDEHEVISFDIFDTLLLRAYAQPGDVAHHLEKLNDEDDFAGKRGYADGIARVRNPQREEITFDQIYEVLGKRFEYLKQQELDMEESSLTANPELLEVFNYAKSKGKKIIIISDMYFSGGFLGKVLQKKGYTGYDKLYVSADVNKTKRSGNLYKHVIDELKISPEKILHIGDNLSVDCEVASHLGMSAFYYEKVINRFFQQNPKATIFYQKNKGNIAASIIIGVSAIKSLTCSDNYWKNLGYDYAGPVAYGYTEWLYKNFKKDGIKDALFVARDGYNLKIIFDLFKDTDIKSHYFYTPRPFSLAIKLGLEYLSKLDDKQLNEMKIVLKYYKNKHPYLHTNTPKISHTSEGVAFIQANYELYKKLAIKEIDGYLEYIKSEDLGDGDIALIDGQSISLTSQKLLSSFIVNKTIRGYYWRYKKSTSYQNAAFHCKAYENGDEWIQKRNWAFMEFLLTAPEKPIYGITNGMTVYQDDICEFEKTRIEKYSIMSEGVLEFAKDIQKYFGGNEIFIEDEGLIDLTNIFEGYPSNEDINNLFKIKLGEDEHYESYYQLFQNWPNSKEKLI